MRAVGLFVLVVAVAWLAAPGAAEEADAPAPAPAADPPTVAIVTLREAANAGHLQVEGFQPSSYQRVHLRMRNQRDEALWVDICGSHLEPRRRKSCQRLGLGPVVTPGSTRRRTQPNPRPEPSPPGTVVFKLEPRQEITVEVNTCCLDSGTPAPRSHTFRVAPEKLPPVREKVLRWWADHPDTPQYAVNTAIWQFREEVIVTRRTRRRPAVPPFTGVAGHAGILYRLRSGELMSLDPDGIERFLGTEIQAVHPTDSAVYAEAYGAVTNDDGERQRELWRLVPTGDEPWRLVARIPRLLLFHDLRVAPDGTVLVTTDQGLFRMDPERKVFENLVPTENLENLSLRFDRKGRVLMTLRRPPQKGYYQGGELRGQGMGVCELWALDPATGERERLREFWNVGQVRAGAAGIYALTPAGKLRYLAGRSFRTAPGQHAYQRILAVGRTCVWLKSKQGRLVATDPIGRQRFARGPRLRALTDWDLDRHTDAVVYLRDGRFYRLDARSGRSELLEPPREDDTR